MEPPDVMKEAREVIGAAFLLSLPAVLILVALALAFFRHTDPMPATAVTQDAAP